MPEFTGLARLWAEGDAISRAVALTLLAMSVASWYLIVARLALWPARRRDRRVAEQFWTATSLEEAISWLRRHAPGGAFAELAIKAAAAAAHYDQHRSETLASHLERDEFLTRAIRQSISLSTSRLEAGLTILASVGSTAPFVGLFGTVWGIYHALQRISIEGSASLEKVSGPVGEALIMTAAGLLVAIPAVIAYNLAIRSNRLHLAALDAFAHDLHAYLSTGARVQSAAGGERS